MQKTQMRKRVKKLAQQIHYKETKKYHNTPQIQEREKMQTKHPFAHLRFLHFR